MLYHLNVLDVRLAEVIRFAMKHRDEVFLHDARLYRFLCQRGVLDEFTAFERFGASPALDGPSFTTMLLTVNEGENRGMFTRRLRPASYYFHLESPGIIALTDFDDTNAERIFIARGQTI